MHPKLHYAALAACLLVLSGFCASRLAAQDLSTDIRLNQVGFYTAGPKVAAVVGSNAASFSVKTPDLSETVFEGVLGSAKQWTPAQESVRLADFSELTTEGEFVLVVPDLGRSYRFRIRPNIHQEVTRAAIKAYYFQRASIRLTPSHAGIWARAAGHPDTNVLVHPSAASPSRPALSAISAPKGWYDAGDYNKYIVNSGISTGTLLMLYEHFPAYFDELETNIPESGNGVPDLLDEVLWNLRWMLAMQDPGDGGVYAKLTTANFEGPVMPSRATSPRYVVQKSTPAALNFVAVAALAARVFEPFPEVLPGLADSLLTAAGHAWNWAQVNPDVRYNQSALNRDFNPDINTGEYGDSNFFDEFRWAAAELFLTTKQDSFVVMYPPFVAPALSAPGWPYVDPLAFVSLTHHRKSIAGVVDTTEVKGKLITLANQYVNLRRESATGTAMGTSSGDFYWGSNSLAANQGLILIQAYRMTADRRYLDAALANLDYLLGRNATGYSFLTAHGSRTPLFPHHRQSEADGIALPVPGLLAGGPNSGRQDGCPYPSTLPAKSYVDSWCSYASNEIAINWNAPLAYLAGALEAIYSPTGRPITTASDAASPPDDSGLGRMESYPNPASDLLHVRFSVDAPRTVMLQVFDVLGRKVAVPVFGQVYAAGTHDVPVDVRSLPPGPYLVRLEDGQAGRTSLKSVVR